LVLEESKSKKILPRDAAMHLAVQRVKKAMAYKRWGIF
jgi:glutamate dehydrogenase (NAD(P)+)